LTLTKILNEYFVLVKPGIVRGNAITAAAGFFLASQGSISWTLLLATVGGLSLVIASACVFNNYIDREIDKKMERTKNRALVKRRVSTLNALTYATLLGLLGFATLSHYANHLTAAIAFIGFFFYVVVYAFFKRKSVHGTLVGSIPGAVPPVVGYCAVTNQVDAAAAILFLILVCWQMAHFYSIGIYRAKDYASANLPILPVKNGFKAAQKQIIFYIFALVGASLLLTFYSYTGYAYTAVVILLSIFWLKLSFKKIDASNAKKWSGKMFGFSIVALTLQSIAIATTHWLP
jgi:protoheme IX farnesyltransferase